MGGGLYENSIDWLDVGGYAFDRMRTPGKGRTAKRAGVIFPYLPLHHTARWFFKLFRREINGGHMKKIIALVFLASLMTGCAGLGDNMRRAAGSINTGVARTGQTVDVRVVQ